MALPDKGCYIGIHFPQDEPPGWYWGKPLPDATTAKKFFWLNFTPANQAYDKGDDIKCMLDSLTYQSYAKTWAVVSPKDFEVQAQEEEEEAGA